LRYRVCRGLSRLGAAPKQRNIRAGARQRPREDQPQAAGTAGDQRDASFKTE
jgi:hypothetical protein